LGQQEDLSQYARQLGSLALIELFRVHSLLKIGGDDLYRMRLSMARLHMGITTVSGTATIGKDLARDREFLGTCAVLFIASAVATIYWCRSMSASMAMPGGWTMSMAWMRMPGQMWLGAAASFVGMWAVMMVAMMLPSLVPMLLSYRDSVRGPDGTRLGRLTALAGAGYFFVWVVFGVISYSVEVSLVAAEKRWPNFARSVPIDIGVVLLLAGSIQFTAWKSRELAHCRNAPTTGPLSPDARSAWQHGVHLGVHCSLCCSGLMMVLLVTGVMSLGAMAVVGVAITVERLTPRSMRADWVTGVIVIAVGVLMIARALGPR
jgi:predicted metal-binding membrane protein